MARSNDKWDFHRAAALPRQRLLVTSFLDDGSVDGPAEITQIVGWRAGEVSSFFLPWEAVDLCTVGYPQAHVVVLGPFGQVHVSSAEGQWEEAITGIEEGEYLHGTLHSLKTIGRHVYAVGMHRQCYRREPGKGPDSPAAWKRQDEGMLVPEPSPEVVGFFSIDGFTEEDMYAVGWQGEIWHYRSGLWIKRDSGTNLLLNHVLCGPDQNTYVAGQAGILLRGRDDAWESIEQDVTHDGFDGAAWYADRLWVATSTNVYFLDADNTLRRADLRQPEPVSAGSLVVGDGILWSIGAYHVFRTTDGEEWTQVFF